MAGPDDRAELERLRKVKRLRELEAKASGQAPAVSTPNPDAFPPQAGLDMADAAPVSPFTGAGATIDARRERESAIKSVMRAASNQANVERMARVKPVEQQAARAGKAATAEAYSKLESPLDMALYGAFSPPYNMEGLAASNRVYDEAGVMPASEAASIRGMNSLALGIPAMVNKNFREDVGQAGRDQPGAALAGDIAGYLVPGEAAWKATAGAYNKTLKPVINAFAPKGGGGLARGARLGQRYGEQAAAWAGQNALFQGTVGESTAAAEEGRDPSLASGLERAGSAAQDPINLLGPAALMGLNRIGKFVTSGGRTATPDSVAAEVGARTAGRSGDGSVLNAERLGGPVDRRAEKILVRMLRDVGYSGDDIRRSFAAFEEASQGVTSDPVLVARLKDVFIDKLGPRAEQVVQDFLQGAGVSKGGTAGQAVADAVGDDYGRLSQFLEDSANARLGAGSRYDTLTGAEQEMSRIGKEGYERVFGVPAADAAAVDDLKKALDFYATSELASPLRQIAAGKMLNVEQMIANDPRRAAHWMQMAAQRKAQEAADAGNDVLAGAYRDMRDNILTRLENPGVTPGYQQARMQFGDEFGVEQAVTFGSRFFTKVADSVGVRQIADDLRNLTPDQQEAALLSIRDELLRIAGRHREGAAPRLSQVGNEQSLAGLEAVVGEKGGQLANDIRFIEDRLARARRIDAGANSRTASNQEAREFADRSVSNPIVRKVGAALNALGGDAALSSVASGGTVPPIFSIRAGMRAMGDKLARGRQGKIDDVTGLLLRDVGPQSRNPMPGDDLPPLPSRTPVGGGSTPPPPANAFASQAPQVSQEATTPGRNPYFGRNAFRTNESGSVTGDVASGLAYGSLGGVSGNFVDYNQDGKQDWQDVGIGAGAGFAGAAGLNRVATTVAGRLPKGQTARLAETQTIPEAAAVIAEKFKPRKITRAATQDDWDEASEEAFNLLKAQAAKQDGFEPGARVWQEEAPDSLTDPKAPPRLVFEDLAEAILRSRGIDPDPVYGRMLAERPTNAETDVFRKTAGHYAGKARAKEREGMALDEMDDTEAAIEQMSGPGPKDPTMNGFGGGDVQNAFVGGTLGYAGDIDRDGERTWKDAAIGGGGMALAGRIPVKTAGKTATAGVPKTPSAKLPAHGYDELRLGKASVEVTRVDDRMTINRLKVPENARGQGEASRALDAVLQQADEQGLTVFLTADPVGSGGLSKAQLEAFYKRHGFVPNKGRNKDFSSQAGMVRAPRSTGKPRTPQQAAKFETPGSPEYEAAIAKGLDMATPARKQRAKEMGFDTDTVLYHGTGADITEFKLPTKGKTAGTGIFLSGDTKKAGSYAKADGAIYPVVVRGKIAEIDAGGRSWADIDTNDLYVRYADDTGDDAVSLFGLDMNSVTSTDELAAAAREAGFDGLRIVNVIDHGGNTSVDDAIEFLQKKGVEIKRYPDGGWDASNVSGKDFTAAREYAESLGRQPSDTTVIFDPSNIRSVNAAFDPDKAGNSDLMAGLPFLVGGAGLGAATQAEPRNAFAEPN